MWQEVNNCMTSHDVPGKSTFWWLEKPRFTFPNVIQIRKMSWDWGDLLTNYPQI